MNRIEAALILFGILFVLIFTFDYLFIKRSYLKRVMGKKKSRKKKNEITEIVYLVNKFKLDKEKLPLNKLLLVISLSNALIISFVSVVVIMLNTYLIIELVVGFVLLLRLIYAIYEIIGRYLERRGYGKNGK